MLWTTSYCYGTSVSSFKSVKHMYETPMKHVRVIRNECVNNVTMSSTKAWIKTRFVRKILMKTRYVRDIVLISIPKKGRPAFELRVRSRFVRGPWESSVPKYRFDINPQTGRPAFQLRVRHGWCGVPWESSVPKYRSDINPQTGCPAFQLRITYTVGAGYREADQYPYTVLTSISKRAPLHFSFVLRIRLVQGPVRGISTQKRPPCISASCYAHGWCRVPWGHWSTFWRISRSTQVCVCVCETVLHLRFISNVGVTVLVVWHRATWRRQSQQLKITALRAKGT